MKNIVCCGHKRPAKNYAIQPSQDTLEAVITVLDECPICGSKVVELTKAVVVNNGSHVLDEIIVIRKVNKKAVDFFEKLKPFILFEIKNKNISYPSSGSWYLSYNEYGKKKKCYSNLSSLKLGLADNTKGLFTKKLMQPAHNI